MLDEAMRKTEASIAVSRNWIKCHQSCTACWIWDRSHPIDPSVVRGLEYYTGPVFECELLMETKDEDGHPVRFGSVGGGGRYDDLVARFTGQSVPATGFSMGVSRLYSALKLLGKTEDKETTAPVVVLVMDKERPGRLPENGAAVARRQYPR